MSKYTTEVRFICEQKAGLSKSGGCDDVDEIIHNSWDKIFNKKAVFFDEDYREILCSKILKHYYLREIGCETVGIWKLWMNCKLEEIMPYYNKLYESALLEFNPFNDVDFTKNHEGVSSGNKSGRGVTDKTGRVTTDVTTDAVSEQAENSTTSNNGTITDDGSYSDDGTVTSSGTETSDGTYSETGSDMDRYSDTPQGTINNVDLDGNSYLTNVRMIGKSKSGSTHDGTTSSGNETRNSTGSNDNIRTVDEDQSASSESNSSSSTASNGVTDTVDNQVVNTVENVENSDSYTERVFGKMSVTPYSDLLQKFRETFLNIDLMVIDEFDELFLRLW